MAVAGPIAALVLELGERGLDAQSAKRAVHDAVSGAVDGAVSDAVSDAVDVAVRDAVHYAVDGAVHDAVDGAVRRGYSRYLGGGWSWWVSYQASSTYFRDVCDLELPGDLWDRSRAYQLTTENAGLWWPHRRFVIACDRPQEIHREQVRPRGWRSHRLHNDSGPAISWRDGWALYFVHGIRVTEQIVMRPETITVQQILKESNAEVRRIMCERYGWARFADDAQLRLVDEKPDPANEPNVLRLWDLPSEFQVFGTPVRLMTCTNATPERDGTVRTFGLTVPVEISDAVAAAGWGWDMSADEYRELERAT